MKDKDYFQEAIQWYLDMYLTPLRDAKRMFMLSLACLFALCAALLFIYNTFPLKQSVSIVVPLKNTIDFRPVLRVLDATKPTKELVVNYLCTKYITARESYDTNRFGSDYAFILHSSSRGVFDSYYQSFADGKNKEAQEVYKDHGKGIVRILDIESDLKSHTAQVKFSKTLIKAKGEIGKTKNYLAKMTYSMSKYDFNKSTTQTLDFTIHKYDVTESNR